MHFFLGSRLRRWRPLNSAVTRSKFNSELGIKVRARPRVLTVFAEQDTCENYHLNNCVVFFEYCVRHKVICVPGIFFDVNPFHRRRFHKSPYIDKLRMSYGPAWPNLKQAVKGMKEIIDLARAGRLPPLDEPPSTA